LLAAQFHGTLTFEWREGTVVTLSFGELSSHISHDATAPDAPEGKAFAYLQVNDLA
jgi:hypothetical protein